VNYSFFVDYENLFREMCNNGPETGDAHEAAMWVVERTLRMLEAEGARVLVARAYADWENLGGHGTQSSLTLMSVRPEYVLAKRGKSSADLELSLSALEILLTREDIDGFVILGGDRDYIPVVSRIRESGKRVRVVGFSKATSGDLIGLVGADNFTDAGRLLRSAGMSYSGFGGLQSRGASATPIPTPPNGFSIPPGSVADAPPSESDLVRCLGLIRTAESRVGREIWLGPFFKNYMNDVFAALNNAQRKRIIQTLRDRGMVRVESRAGSYLGGTYSVLILNRDHPDVIAALGAELTEEEKSEAKLDAEIDNKEIGVAYSVDDIMSSDVNIDSYDTHINETAADMSGIRSDVADSLSFDDE